MSSGGPFQPPPFCDYCHSIPPAYVKLSALQWAETSACCEGQGAIGDPHQHSGKGVKASVSLPPLLTLLPHWRCLLSAGLWVRLREWEIPWFLSGPPGLRWQIGNPWALRPSAPGLALGKGAGRDGTSVLQLTIHISPLSPRPDLLYTPLPTTALPPWERCGTGAVPGWECSHHGACLLPPLAGTTSTCPTLRRSPVSTSRAGGRTSAAGCIMPTSWTRLRTSWSVGAEEGDSWGHGAGKGHIQAPPLQLVTKQGQRVRGPTSKLLP